MVVVLALLAIPLAIIVSVAFWIALKPMRLFPRLAAALACGMAIPAVFAMAFLMVGPMASDSYADLLQVSGIYLGLTVVASLIAIGGSWLVSQTRSK
jgi:hypothetical protein